MIVKEIASGVNDSRPKLLAWLDDPTITCIVVVVNGSGVV
jgi:predicted site-specific integrase-resolvase